MREILEQHIGNLLTGLVALVLGWLGKSQIQKKSDQADLTSKIQEVYREMVVDTDKTIDNLREEIKLQKEKQELRNDQWIKKLDDIEKTWQTKYSRLQTKYNHLLKKLDLNEK